jgi:hypothetical protein
MLLQGLRLQPLFLVVEERQIFDPELRLHQMVTGGHQWLGATNCIEQFA